MNSSQLFIIAVRHLKPLLLLLSLIALYRGHNEPGGGFIGGLLAGSAYVLYAMAFGVEKTKKLRPVKPFLLIPVGLSVSLLSGLWGMMKGKAFMTALWTELALPAGIKLKLGTPLLFDLGVYITVAGMLMLVMLTIMEE